MTQQHRCTAETLCPCTSMEAYGSCCKPYHDGAEIPDALSMLRSRYSAHCLMLVDFVVRTSHPLFRHDLSETSFREHTEQSMKNVRWLSLEVHNTGIVPAKSDADKVNDMQGVREFATYSLRYQTLGKDLGVVGKEFYTQHTSYFERLNNVLYYTTDLDTLMTRTPVRREAHIGRNETCPCGSGKKYKKCCLHKDTEEA